MVALAESLREKPKGRRGNGVEEQARQRLEGQQTRTEILEDYKAAAAVTGSSGGTAGRQMASGTKSDVQRLLADVATGGSATAAACIFTNPLEVVKTRLQLQGEMQGCTTGAQPQRYKGVADAIVKMARQEGAAALQKGLAPGMVYQVFMNGTRLGCYPTLKRILNTDGADNFLQALGAGAISGALGAVAGSPFFMVKCRLQAQSTVSGVDGFQHHYKGMTDGLLKVWRGEGLAGLFRGVDGAVPRVMVGSAAQLASYDACKRRLLASGVFQEGVLCHFGASMVSGLVVTTALNPFDVVSTRLYNQPQGAARVYSGPVDCALKTARSEGFTGFYKGWFAHYCRLGPHTVLTLVFWEQTRRLARRCGF